MRIINTSVITMTISRLIAKLSCQINLPCQNALTKAFDMESNSASKFALEMMNKNTHLAQSNNIPVCQDTGMAIVFISLGKDVFLEGELLSDAINRGVKLGYKNLRASIVSPLTRVNSGDNTPAIIHTDIVDGQNIGISVMLKGFGSENMSRLYMLTPADGISGVKNAIIETARIAGSNPCPPIILGVGIGGDMEKASIIAKHALLREVGSKNCDDNLSKLEDELLHSINALGIGTQGFGGKTSALGVFIEEFPTHISALPVAINVLCHCQRSGSEII